MNKPTIHPHLRKNIQLYSWVKIFSKRVFLPVTAIYLVDIGQLSLVQLGIVGTITGIVTLIGQIPTGHFADHHSRRSAMMIGAALLAAGSAALVLSASFVGALLAGVLSGVGFSFLSGAGQSLIHDSLERWGDVKNYVKVLGRAQSKGLIGNLILVGLVPMTYVLDPRMPFALGVVAFATLFCLAWAFVEPASGTKDTSEPHKGGYVGQILAGVRLFINRNTVLLFIAIGLLSGLYSAPTDYSNLILKDLGTAPQYIGWIFSGSSLIGAIGGYFLHHMQQFSFKTFIFIDIAVCCLFFVIIGVTRNLWVAIAVTLVNLGFWRLRSIIFQHHLLEAFKGTSRKTVLISLLGFGEQLFTIVLPISIATLVTHLGYYNGYIAIGLVGGLLLSILAIASFIGFHKHKALAALN